MRNFKIGLWIFVIFLIQTVILSQVRLFGAVPSLALSYIICVTILENEFRTAVTISIICAAAMGALGGRGFAPTTLFYVYASIAVFALRNKPAYVSDIIKTLAWTFIVSFAAEVMYFALGSFTLTVPVLTDVALPTAVANTVLSLALYPLLKLTMYRDEKKRLLIV